MIVVRARRKTKIARAALPPSFAVGLASRAANNEDCARGHVIPLARGLSTLFARANSGPLRAVGALRSRAFNGARRRLRRPLLRGDAPLNNRKRDSSPYRALRLPHPPPHQTNSPTNLWVRSGGSRTGQNSHHQTNSGSDSPSGQRLGHEPPRNQLESRSEATRNQASTRSAPCPCWAAAKHMYLLRFFRTTQRSAPASAAKGLAGNVLCHDRRHRDVPTSNRLVRVCADNRPIDGDYISSNEWGALGVDHHQIV